MAFLELHPVPQLSRVQKHCTIRPTQHVHRPTILSIVLEIKHVKTSLALKEPPTVVTVLFSWATLNSVVRSIISICRTSVSNLLAWNAQIFVTEFLRIS